MIFYYGVLAGCALVFTGVLNSGLRNKFINFVLRKKQFVLDEKEILPVYSQIKKFRKLNIRHNLNLTSDVYEIEMSHRIENTGNNDSRYFVLLKNDFLNKLNKILDYTPLFVGDKKFDNIFLTLKSCEISMISICSRRIREYFIFLNENSEIFRIEKSMIYVKFTANRGSVNLKIKKIGNMILAISEDLSRNISARRRLIFNVSGDSIQEVRLSNFFALIVQFPDDTQFSKIIKNIMTLKNGKYCFKEDIASLENKMKLRIFEIIEFFKFSNFEDFLISEMMNSDSTLLMIILRVLGAVGTVKSVEHVLKTASSASNPFIRSACHDAVAAIQSRAGNAEKGWVSMTAGGGMSGALSKAAGRKITEKGSLSLKRKK